MKRLRKDDKKSWPNIMQHIVGFIGDIESTEWGKKRVRQFDLL
jgi:hypothetical protein